MEIIVSAFAAIVALGCMVAIHLEGRKDLQRGKNKSD